MADLFALRASVSFQRRNCAPLLQVFNRATPAIVFLNSYSQPSGGPIYLQASLLRIAEDANRFRCEDHSDAETIHVNLECFRCEMSDIVATVSQDVEGSSGGTFFDLQYQHPLTSLPKLHSNLQYLTQHHKSMLLYSAKLACHHGRAMEGHMNGSLLP